MLKSRTMAIAGTIAALSLAAAPIASASTDTHSGKSSPDRIQRVDKKSPDKTNSRDRQRPARREEPPLTTMAGAAGGHPRPPRRPSHQPTPARATNPV